MPPLEGVLATNIYVRSNVANNATVEKHVSFWVPNSGRVVIPTRGLQTVISRLSIFGHGWAPCAGYQVGPNSGPFREQRKPFKFPSRTVRDKKFIQKRNAFRDQIRSPRGYPVLIRFGFRAQECVHPWEQRSSHGGRQSFCNRFCFCSRSRSCSRGSGRSRHH